jgi:hypothetical protein
MSTTAPQTNVMQYRLQTEYDNILPTACEPNGTGPHDPDRPDRGVSQDE